MIVVPKDLLTLGGAGGENFEAFVRGLVMAECRLHGIPPTSVDWDYRTSCPDGGCDIFVRQGHTDPKPRFIPNEPSVWCVKSGADGIKTTTLSKEIKIHSLLRLHLSQGKKYIWCALQPISQTKRKAMHKKAEVLAQQYKFKTEQIIFVWIDALQDIVEDYPNIIAIYLPEVANRAVGIKTLTQWQRESPDSRGLEVKWVEFGERNVLIQRIQEHLLGSNGPAVIHIAGLSGIGKTRTAIQACLNKQELNDTLYVSQVENLSQDFFSYLDSGTVSVRLIIDEVSLDKYQPLAERYKYLNKQVRIVTIGPARRDERGRNSDLSLLLMEEPSITNGILPVVMEAGQSLRKEVLQSIAKVSGHDLRLALLLVFATQQNPDFHEVPVRNLDDVWSRVTTLFSTELGDTSVFKERYDILTSAIDIGHTGNYRHELEYLALHFGKVPYDLDQAIHASHVCGLGQKAYSFFEAGPRALAVWIFQDRLWPILNSTIDNFLGKMTSDRLRRRFIERCQEVKGPVREEILNQVGNFFLTYFSPPNIIYLINREKSRVFQSWAETDPERGLGWLKNAIEIATNDDLRKFSGDPDGSGGWQGRRQVVWLCEHLACFEEYFWDCEFILFRLAQVETEQSIANNSTNTWKAMFLPVLSNTEVPFPKRLQKLLERLNNVSDQTLDLILSAAIEILETHLSRQVPPSVVGGRVVPDEWRPRTTAELDAFRQSTARAVLKCINGLSPSYRQRAIDKVIDELFRFVYLGIVPELRDTIEFIEKDSARLRILRIKLDDVIYRIELFSDHNKKDEPQFLNDLRVWRKEIEPQNISEQIIDLTGRFSMSAHRRSDGKMTDEAEEVYGSIAQSVIEQPRVIDGLEDWFNSESCLSSQEFAFHLGKVDKDLSLMPIVLKWMQFGKAGGFIVGYLRSISFVFGGLPEEVTNVLDKCIETFPILVTNVTIHADISPNGFKRLMICINHLKPDERRVLGTLQYGPWSKFLDTERKNTLLEYFEKLDQAGDTYALTIIFNLLGGWTHHGKKKLEKVLSDKALLFLQVASKPQKFVDDYDWKIIAEMLMETYPAEIAEVLADTITDVESHRFNRSRYAEELFKQVAKTNPKESMRAIGRWVLDDKRGQIFRFWVFRGIFDAIGLETVKSWIEEHGITAAIRIARHLDGPYLNEDGKPIVPELADWILTKYAHNKNVFQEFCMGRYSGMVRVGFARERLGEIEKLTAPFLKDQRRWVHDWVKYEKASLQSEIENEEKWEDERNRT